MEDPIISFTGERASTHRTKFLTMKSFRVVLFIVIGILAVLFAYYQGVTSSLAEKKTTEKAEVVLEKIEKVTKLVTTEATLSEFYTYQDYYNWDWSFLRKKALVRVKGKIMAGYDFNKLQITVDQSAKIIRVSDFPTAPEILAIDHEIDYYDIEEGMFNSFTPETFNQINASAKDKLKQAAISSQVLADASAQGDELKELINMIGNAAGYTVFIEEAPDPLKD